MQLTGSYPNVSNYVRVKSVSLTTPNYLGSNGVAQSQFTSSLPLVGSGSLNGAFKDATGALFGGLGIQPLKMYESIPNTTSDQTNNIQGLVASSYDKAISLLGNKDEYAFNVIYAPGLTSQNASSQINSLLNLAQTRGDAIAVVDMVGYGQNIGTVTAAATGYDNMTVSGNITLVGTLSTAADTVQPKQYIDVMTVVFGS
jgi:hypothetical protein